MKRKTFPILIVMFLLSVSFAFSQPRCNGDFDLDGDVDSKDLSVFSSAFGRTDCEITATPNGNFFKGMVIMFSGEIDANGNPLINGVPDVRWKLCTACIGKFIRGASASNIGETGGSDEAKLEKDNMPPHDHVYHTERRQGRSIQYLSFGPLVFALANSTNEFWLSSTEGKAKPFNIVPGYYALAFLVFVGDE